MRFVILLSRELELPDLPRACGSEAWPAGRASWSLSIHAHLGFVSAAGGLTRELSELGSGQLGFHFHVDEFTRKITDWGGGWGVTEVLLCRGLGGLMHLRYQDLLLWGVGSAAETWGSCPLKQGPF